VSDLRPPVAYETLLKKALSSLPDEFEKGLHNDLERVCDRWTQALREELPRVYLEGVRDGFAQGVAAEVASKGNGGQG